MNRNKKNRLIKHQISRRRFLKKSALTVTGMSLMGMAPVTTPIHAYNSSLRVIAYNVLACTGWPKDRKQAVLARKNMQMPLRMALELSLYEPDIITFSESPEESVIKEIAELLQMDYAFFPSAGNWPGVIFTRFEIIRSENVPIVGKERPEDLFTRHWGKAYIKTDQGRDIIVHSAHLYPHDNPKSSGIRQREIALILESLQADIRSERPLLLMGDLNHYPNTPESKLWTDGGWVDTFIKVGTGEGGTIRADEPSRRIDYVLAHGSLGERVTESRPLFEGAFRTNPDDPDSFALSDHLPQMAIFELDE